MNDNKSYGQQQQQQQESVKIFFSLIFNAALALDNIILGYQGGSTTKNNILFSGSFFNHDRIGLDCRHQVELSP